MLPQQSIGSSGCRKFVDSYGSASAELDFAQRGVSGDAEVPALFGSLRRAVHGLWHIAGGGKFCLVVHSSGMHRCSNRSRRKYGPSSTDPTMSLSAIA